MLYSSSLNGNLDGCGCQNRPRAGLARRAAWLRAYPDRAGALLVDAGDLLDVQEDPDLSGAIQQTYRELGYEAIAVGDQELVDGIDALAGYSERCPLGAHNLAFRFDDRCLFFSVAPQVLVKGGQRVGLIALLDPEVFRLYPQAIKERIKLEPPAQTAAVLVQGLQEKGADWVVVLYRGSVRQAEKLARGVPGIDLIIVGHEQRLLPPHRIGGTVIASPGEEGNRVGILTLSRDGQDRIHFRNEFRLLRYEQDPADPLVREWIEEYGDKLRRVLDDE